MQDKNVVIGFAVNPKADAFADAGGLGLIARLVSTSKSIAPSTYAPIRHSP